MVGVLETDVNGPVNINYLRILKPKLENVSKFAVINILPKARCDRFFYSSVV